ncbi:MAG: hypothetical protein VB858_06220 [Planctomycetaceae bacterium]
MFKTTAIVIEALSVATVFQGQPIPVLSGLSRTGLTVPEVGVGFVRPVQAGILVEQLPAQN